MLKIWNRYFSLVWHAVGIWGITVNARLSKHVSLMVITLVDVIKIFFSINGLHAMMT